MSDFQEKVSWDGGQQLSCRYLEFRVQFRGKIAEKHIRDDGGDIFTNFVNECRGIFCLLCLAHGEARHDHIDGVNVFDRHANISWAQWGRKISNVIQILGY